MAALKENVKLFIVIGLARHLTPSQVVDAVKEEFELVVSRMQVQTYDPTKAQGKSLSKKFKEIFLAARKKFIDEESETPISLKNYRLQILQINLNRAMHSGNIVLANQTIEQAAKEANNFYSNKLQALNEDNQFLLLYQQISGTSLPVIEDDKEYYQEAELVEETAQIEEKVVSEPVKDLDTDKTEAEKKIKSKKNIKRNLFDRD